MISKPFDFTVFFAFYFLPLHHSSSASVQCESHFCERICAKRFNISFRLLVTGSFICENIQIKFIIRNLAITGACVEYAEGGLMRTSFCSKVFFCVRWLILRFSIDDRLSPY